MLGAIRKREILAHPFVTIQCFGWPIFVRALIAGRDRTFLSLLADGGAFEARGPDVPLLLDRCIALEERASRIYSELARRFAPGAPLAGLFESLSSQESQHAELLRVCAEVAAARGPASWRPDREELSLAVDHAERRISAEEAALRRATTADEILRAVIRIEDSEIDRTFALAVGATDSAFVRALDSFHSSESRHREYLYGRIVALAPGLAEEARVLLTPSATGPRGAGLVH